MNEMRRIEPPPAVLLLPAPGHESADEPGHDAAGGQQEGKRDQPREEQRDGQQDEPNEPARKRRRGWGWAVVGLAVVGALGWGGWRHWHTRQEASRTQQETQDFRPRLRVAQAKKQDGPIPLTLPGQLVPDAQARLFARATGYVAELRVDIGTRVKKGDLLLRIAAPDLDAQLQQAAAQVGQMQASLNRATADVDTARSNVDLARVTNARTSTLAAQGWETRQNADNTRTSLQTNSASLESALAGVKVAEANLKAQLATVQRLQELVAYEQVVAPFDGVVTARAVDQGDLVNADSGGGTALFSLVQDSVVRAQVRVPQSAAIGLRTGLEARVQVPELPGRTFTGQVARRAVALDPTSRTMLVEADFPNPEGLLHPGLFADITIDVPRTTAGIVIPAEAIRYDADGLHVFVVKDNKARMRHISIYRDFGTTVELRDGLDGTEQVALSPPASLQDGADVQVQQPDQDKPGQDGSGGTTGNGQNGRR